MEIGNKMHKMSWKFKLVLVIQTGLMLALGLFLFDYIFDNELWISGYILQGVIFGFLMGFTFPYLNGNFGKRYSSPMWKSIQPELQENEQIEIEGPANLFRGIEGVGGKIFLTDRKMIFKSHKMNIQRGQTNIEYQNIKEIVKRKTAKLIDNGFRIKTKDGKEYDFVVNERDLWVEKISERIK